MVVLNCSPDGRPVTLLIISGVLSGRRNSGVRVIHLSFCIWLFVGAALSLCNS